MPASERHRRSNKRKTEDSKDGIKFLMWASIIAIAATFIMCLIGTKVYMSSASGLDITALVKKGIFVVFVLANTIPMLTSVISLMHLIWAQRQSEFQLIQKAMLRAMALVTVSYVSLFVAFVVGVCLVLMILLPLPAYFK
ncbi:unnamed protein product [Cochlearia groenlandica]